MLTFLILAATAAPHDFVAHMTRLGGDTAAAQPFIDKFCRYVEGKMGWPADSVHGKFFPAKGEAIAYVDSAKPGFGMFEPAVFFELKDSKKLDALVNIQSKDLTWTKLNVVVKDPAFKTLEDLKGKTLCATGADSPKYLSKYVFGGKIDAAKHFTLKPLTQPLKGIRGVLRGECDATLLEDEMLKQAATMEGGAELKSIHQSAQLPPTPLASIGAAVSAADKKKLATVLLAMCDTAEGKAICQDMRVEKFVVAK